MFVTHCAQITYIQRKVVKEDRWTVSVTKSVLVFFFVLTNCFAIVYFASAAQLLLSIHKKE